MSKRFMRILTELQNVSSIEEKAELTHSASLALAKDTRYADNFLYFIFSKIIVDDNISKFSSIVDSEFYNVSVIPYTDVDDYVKISVQMSFLQDFNDPVNDLDEMVMFAVFKELLKQNLDLLVNDICINVHQLRDGEQIS